MKRKVIEFSIPESFFEKLLSASGSFDPVMILNSNRLQQWPDDSYGAYDLLAGFGSIKASPEGGCFNILQNFLDEKDWLFGAFSYDLKNEIHHLTSSNSDNLRFPLHHFFVPRFVLAIPKGESLLRIYYLPSQDDKSTATEFFNTICSARINNNNIDGCSISPRVSKEAYIRNVNRIKEHIQRGDIYEMNYCIEFFSEDVVLDPEDIFLKLNQLSPMPFSSFYKSGYHYLLCCSPERFLKKQGRKIISQPIKGTARRGANESEDERIKEQLRLDPKEQSENVMIVDLVRNDLSQTAARGSVQVEELFEIHSFSTLHQMISTVTSVAREEMKSTDIIRHAFPMGSMTGAPKHRAMQLIEEFEDTRRGLYSGSVGYFTPDGDFDLNVVIRSLLYNAQTKYLSFMAGSAITIHSDPEKEYDECLLKAKAIMKVLSDERSISKVY